MTRRTMLYAGALVVVAGGAVAVQVASGADAPADASANAPSHTSPPVVAHAMPHTAAHPPSQHPAAPPAHVAPDTVVVERESFGYTGGGRRDPFHSLMATAALRPLPSELRLVAVAYDPTGVGSVAILRDGTTRAQHRVGVGDDADRARRGR